MKKNVTATISPSIIYHLQTTEMQVTKQGKTVSLFISYPCAVFGICTLKHLQLHLLIVTFQEESEELACSSAIEKKGSYIFILSTNEICPRYICRPFYLKCKDFYKTFIMLTNVLLMSNHIFSNQILKNALSNISIIYQ